jgi:hypothetical protein
MSDGVDFQDDTISAKLETKVGNREPVAATLPENPVKSR